MIHFDTLKSREEWLKARAERIGGSDAACLLGLNPWKSNVQLWREKKHPETVKEIDNEAMKYGRDAEPHIRALFALDHPSMKVMYLEDNIWTNDEYPFAHASLDGWMEDETGRFGVLEIKTVTIRSRVQETEWRDRIPNNYYCQILWYMMVTNASFAKLTALIHKFNAVTEFKTYDIDRTDEVEGDIRMLRDAGKKFWESLSNSREPALILPSV